MPHRVISTAKPEKVCPIQLFLKVAAPWGRGDLSAVASGYSISGFAIGHRLQSRPHTPMLGYVFTSFTFRASVVANIVQKCEFVRDHNHKQQ